MPKSGVGDGPVCWKHTQRSRPVCRMKWLMVSRPGCRSSVILRRAQLLQLTVPTKLSSAPVRSVRCANQQLSTLSSCQRLTMDSYILLDASLTTASGLAMALFTDKTPRLMPSPVADTGAELCRRGGVTRVTSHPPSAAACFMLLLCR